MKRECPFINAYIPIVDCVGCDDPCNNKIILEDTERLASIFLRMFPNTTYVDSEQAYNMIINEINSINKKLYELVDSVLYWWYEHKYDQTGDYGENNVYDEDPPFIEKAEEITRRDKNGWY